jgi:hypothetical protein
MGLFRKFEFGGVERWNGPPSNNKQSFFPEKVWKGLESLGKAWEAPLLPPGGLAKAGNGWQRLEF